MIVPFCPESLSVNVEFPVWFSAFFTEPFEYTFPYLSMLIFEADALFVELVAVALLVLFPPLVAFVVELLLIVVWFAKVVVLLASMRV